MSHFKPGDRVVRIGPSFLNVERGKVYEVKRVNLGGNLVLKGCSETGYDPAKFILESIYYSPLYQALR